MVNVRIGNNINVLWKVYDSLGAKYFLPGKIQRLWLSSAALEKEIATYETYKTNELSFTVDAGDLTRYGTYKLTLEIRESESETRDATYDLTQVFQVVSGSYPDATNGIDGEIDVEFTSVINNLVLVSGDGSVPGFNAYEDTVWNKAQTLTDEQKAQALANLGIDISEFVKIGDEYIVDGQTSTETE